MFCAGSQDDVSWTEAVAGEGRDAAPFNVLLTCYTLFERDSTEQKLDRQFLRKWRWSHMVLVRNIAGALCFLYLVLITPDTAAACNIVVQPRAASVLRKPYYHVLMASRTERATTSGLAKQHVGVQSWSFITACVSSDRVELVGW